MKTILSKAKGDTCLLVFLSTALRVLPVVGFAEQIIAFVESSFKGASLREKQNAKMRFEIPQQEDKTLGSMFGIMEVCGHEYAPEVE